MNRDQNKDKNKKRRGVTTAPNGRGDRKRKRISSAKSLDTDMSSERRERGSSERPVQPDISSEKSEVISNAKSIETDVSKEKEEKKDTKALTKSVKRSNNDNQQVNTKSIVIMLIVDLVIGIIVGAICYVLSSNVTELKSLLLYFGMMILIGVILHVVVDMVIKKTNQKDDGDGSYKHADKTTLILYAVSFVIMVLAASAAFAKIVNDNLHHENIYEGVYIYDIDASNMTYQQALDAVTQKVQSQLDTIDFNLYVDDVPHNINSDNVGMTSDINDKLYQAYYYAREGSVFTRLDQVFTLRSHTVNFPITFVPNESYIQDIANNISTSLYSEVKDATMEFVPGEGEDFVYTEDTVGRQINSDDIVTAVKNNCNSMQFQDIYLNTTVTNPQVTLEELKKTTELIATYTTHLEDDGNRTANVDLASTMLEGVVLPGEVFSFNAKTGERTKSAGYKVAHAIANGTELVDAVAGGVCQAASTLHAALLHTDITVLERHNHSFKVSYMSAGMDATVDYYMPLDFKFENTTGYQLYISCYVTYNEPDKYGVYDNTLTVNVYGTNPNPDRTVEIRVETLETYAGGFNKKYTSELAAGKTKYTSPRVSGRKTNTYKDIYVNGELIESILLYEEDIYHSVNGTMLVGTG